MSTWEALNEKMVVLKLDFLDRAIKAKVLGIDDAVLRFTSPELEKELTAPAMQVAVAMGDPRYYIPTARIQFVMIDAL